MAIIEVKVPQLSESVAEATLLQWKKRPGEAVELDEILIEIETDKVVLEVPAPAAGVIAEHVKQDGATVLSDEVIARIDTEGRATGGSAAAATVKPAAPPAAAATPAAVPAAAPAGSVSGVAMPSAAKLMADNKLAAGSGPRHGQGRPHHQGRRARRTRGRGGACAVAERSAACRRAAGRPAAAARVAPAASLALGERPEQRVPMSRLRARIAERLLQSQATNAILTTFNEVNRPLDGDAQEVPGEVREGARREARLHELLRESGGRGPEKYPVINASVDGTDIVYHGYFDIGIAVGSPRGLVVPVLRNADQMSFADIEKKIADFGTKARDGKLAIEELTGGTFSISNGGVFGSMLSTPIINPPQSAILGVHATKDRAVVENGQVVVRPINYLAMSYDHRIIDGREAVLGLVTMKEALEGPARLLFDI